MIIDLSTLKLSPLFWIAITVYMLPGISFFILLRSIYASSIGILRSRDPIVIFFSAFILSTVYWLIASAFIMRLNLNSNILVTIISLGTPIVITSLSLIHKLIHKLKERKERSVTIKHSLQRLIIKVRKPQINPKQLIRFTSRIEGELIKALIFIVVLLISLSFFYWAYYAESLYEVLPAGYDRNSHLARVFWFLEKNSIMVYSFGTKYLNFYPVGMHMILATIIRISFYIANVLNIQQITTDFLANWETVSILFCEIICFFLALYPIAIYTISKELGGKREGIGLASAIASLALIGNVAVLEPFHNLIGNYLVGFIAVVLCWYIKRDLLADPKHVAFLALILASIALIHTFSLVYAAILFAIILTYYLGKHIIAYMQGRKEVHIKKLALATLLTPIIGFIYTLIIYPEYVFGEIFEMLRRMHAREVYEDLVKYSTTGLPQTPSMLSVEGLLTQTKFALKGVYAICLLSGTTLALAAIFIYFWGRAILIDNIKVHKPKFDTMYLLLFIIVSAIYTLTPILPKMGIEEVRGVYLYAISLGGALYLLYKSAQEWLRTLASIIQKKRVWLARHINTVGKIIKIFIIIVSLLSLTPIFESSNSLAKQTIEQTRRGRIVGYIKIQGVYKLAEAIKNNVPPSKAIVYPRGGDGDVERFILSLLINNTIYMAGIYVDMPMVSELAKLYMSCKVWIIGEYYTVRFNINDTYYMDIVEKYNIGAIIETSLFRLNHNRILRLFPRSKIIKVSTYYTLVVLGNW